jgi:hypothetical protein
MTQKTKVIIVRVVAVIIGAGLCAGMLWVTYGG